MSSKNIATRVLAAAPIFIDVGDLGTPRTISVSSADPRCVIALRTSPDGSGAGPRVKLVRGTGCDRRSLRFLAFEVIAGDDRMPTVTLSGPIASAGPVGGLSGDLSAANDANDSAPASGRARRDPTRNERSVPRRALQGPSPVASSAWSGVEQAALLLGIPTITLRRTLERHARRADDGTVTARADGITARKLGRQWRVRLDAGWLDPDGKERVR